MLPGFRIFRASGATARAQQVYDGRQLSINVESGIRRCPGPWLVALAKLIRLALLDVVYRAFWELCVTRSRIVPVPDVTGLEASYLLTSTTQ
jgi:hypothetical protein